MARKDAAAHKDARADKTANLGRQAAPADKPRRQWVPLVMVSVSVLAVCGAVRYFWPAEEAVAQRSGGNTGAPHATQPAHDPNVAALVNGEQITRQELGADCVRHYGKDVLESLVNKELILDHCEAKGIKITNREIDAEIERMAKRFNVSVEQWITLLKKERDISIEQYRRDVIWPTLALKKLAAESLVVTDKEFLEAYESQYGPQVKVRMIGVFKDETKAKKALAAAQANPQDFDRLVTEYSEDNESASVKGWIPPIRKHVGEKILEQAAFALKEGEVSPLLQVKEHYYVILFCEGHVPAQQVDVEVVRPQLEELIKDRKLKEAAATLFAQLQKTARIENVFNDPVKSRQMPGVAAMINGGKIMLTDLIDECLARHGRDTLDGLVNRRVIEQDLKRRQVQMSEDDINEEVADAAKRMMPPNAAGQPDVKGWLKKVTSEPGVTVENYVRDSVWPSVAMKLLVKPQVKVEKEDLDRAFEANYGPRVRCAAIVMDNLRRSKEVWEMARKKQGAADFREHFGLLSEQYSTDASVRTLKGTIPPIGRHCGQPLLEKEAFALKPGEMSGIVQVEEKCVILLCEGRTEPIAMEGKDRAEAEQKLHDLVYRQKLSAAMARKFDQLQTTARIVNYLDPSKSREPASQSAEGQARRPVRTGEAAK